MKYLYLAIATGLGTGKLRPASGTWGTLPGIPLVLLLAPLSPPIYLLATVIIFFVGVKVSNFAEFHYGESDSGNIVIDEIVGYLVTMFLVPVTAAHLIWAFFLFRFFDIVKIWPARAIDRGGYGGMGVMADDVAAAVYANIVLQVLVALGWFGCGVN